MDNREPLLRSDWTTYRGGAVVFNGAEDAAIEDCDFDQLGGNAIFVNNYNRRIAVRGCLIRESGANGVAFVGDPKAVRSPLFNYKEQVRLREARPDARPDGRQLSRRLPGGGLPDHAQRAVREADRAGADRDGAGHHRAALLDLRCAARGHQHRRRLLGRPLIEYCDVFDTVLETGDHGSFNSWGRDRYWHPDVRAGGQAGRRRPDAAVPGHGPSRSRSAQQPLALRPRLGHRPRRRLQSTTSSTTTCCSRRPEAARGLRAASRRTTSSSTTACTRTSGIENSGDVFTGNIVMGAYRPARMDIAQMGQGGGPQPVHDLRRRPQEIRRQRLRREFAGGRSAVHGRRERRFPRQGRFARPEAGLREFPDGPVRRAHAAPAGHGANAGDSAR